MRRKLAGGVTSSRSEPTASSGAARARVLPRLRRLVAAVQRGRLGTSEASSGGRIRSFATYAPSSHSSVVIVSSRYLLRRDSWCVALCCCHMYRLRSSQITALTELACSSQSERMLFSAIRTIRKMRRRPRKRPSGIPQPSYGTRAALTWVVPPLDPIVKLTVTGFVVALRFSGEPATANAYRFPPRGVRSA